MHLLSTAGLLNVWERGFAQSPAQRALALLAFACKEMPTEQLAQLGISQRDTLLLTLRERTFGPQLASIASCPGCGEKLEFSVDAAKLRAIPPADSDGTMSLTHAKFYVEFRLPNSLDLTKLDPASDEETNRQHLLRCCVLSARRDGAYVAPAELPPDVQAAIAQRMAEADPQADVQLALSCPNCGHKWRAPLNIAPYFWSEIHAWAGRILREIHTLASAYGWREADILALSPRRRQAYLEMIDR